MLRLQINQMMTPVQNNQQTTHKTWMHESQSEMAQVSKKGKRPFNALNVATQIVFLDWY